MVPRAGRLQLNIAINSHRRQPFLHRLFWNIIDLLQSISSTTPFNGIGRYYIYTYANFFNARPNIRRHLFGQAGAPTHRIIVGLKFHFPCHLTRTLRVFVLRTTRHQVVVLRGNGHLSLNTRGRQAIVMGNVVRIGNRHQSTPREPMGARCFPHLTHKYTTSCARTEY